MNKITQHQVKSSHKLLNQYYLHKYNTQMNRLNKFISDEMIIEEEGDGVIDQMDEIQYQRNQSLDKIKKTNNSTKLTSKRRSVSGDVINTLLSNQGKYSKRSPQKQTIVKKQSNLQSNNSPVIKFEPQIVQKQLKPVKRELFDLSKPLNSIRQVSETQSLFGPPRTIFSDKSKISSIQKIVRDDDTKSIGQKSYYSAAVQSKLTKGSSPLRKSKKQKKNFKKAFLQRKYQTTNLNQTTHKSQHQSQLHIRQNIDPSMINFSMMNHQRRLDQDDKKQQIMLTKDFKKVGQSLQRELNQQANWQNIPQIPLGKSTLLVTKPIKQLLVDNTSIFQNVDIKENDSEAVYSDDESMLQKSQFHQAIGQAFEKRLAGSQVSSQKQSSRSPSKNSSPFKIKKSNQIDRVLSEQQSQQPSVAPQMYSEKNDDSSVFSSQYGYQINATPARNCQDPRQIITMKKYDKQAQQKRKKIQQQHLKQIRISKQLQQKRIKIQSQTYKIFQMFQQEQQGVFSGSIRKIKQLLQNQNVQLNIKQILLTTSKKLVLDSKDLEHKMQAKQQQLEVLKNKTSHLVDYKGQRKKSQYYDEIESIIKNSEHQVETKEQEQRLVMINKVVIKKLIQKCCQALARKAQTDLQ